MGAIVEGNVGQKDLVLGHTRKIFKAWVERPTAGRVVKFRWNESVLWMARAPIRAR